MRVAQARFGIPSRKVGVAGDLLDALCSVTQRSENCPLGLVQLRPGGTGPGASRAEHRIQYVLSLTNHAGSPGEEVIRPSRNGGVDRTWYRPEVSPQVGSEIGVMSEPKRSGASKSACRGFEPLLWHGSTERKAGPSIAATAPSSLGVAKSRQRSPISVTERSVTRRRYPDLHVVPMGSIAALALRCHCRRCRLR